MKNTTRRFITNAFALALAANGATAFAQNSPQDKPQEKKVERQVWVDSGGPTFDRLVPVPEHIGPGAPHVMAFTGTGSPQDGFSYSFVASEVGTSGKVVKGMPYSAEVVNEFVQTLANGNRIVRRNTSNVYRDTQGRTRREQSLPTLPGSPVPAELANAKIVILTDPVEGVTYLLDDKTKIAQRARIGGTGAGISFSHVSGGSSLGGGAMTIVTEKVVTTTNGQTATVEPMKKITVSGGVLQRSAINKVQPPYPAEAKAARASGAVQVQVTISETGEVISADVVSGHPLLRDASLNAARQWKFKPTELSGQPVKVQGILTFNFTLTGEELDNQPPAAPDSDGPAAHKFTGLRVNLDTTQLGKQMIEGLECEGTRIVETIPAGQIGNDQPIEIVTERWFSPELQLTVLTKHSDPRMGDTTVRMANLLRVEPDQFLFKVPSDYVIKDGGGAQTFIRTTKPE